MSRALPFFLGVFVFVALSLASNFACAQLDLKALPAVQAFEGRLRGKDALDTAVRQTVAYRFLIAAIEQQYNPISPPRRLDEYRIALAERESAGRAQLAKREKLKLGSKELEQAWQAKLSAASTPEYRVEVFRVLNQAMYPPPPLKERSVAHEVVYPLHGAV